MIRPCRTSSVPTSINTQTQLAQDPRKNNKTWPQKGQIGRNRHTGSKEWSHRLGCREIGLSVTFSFKDHRNQGNDRKHLPTGVGNFFGRRDMVTDSVIARHVEFAITLGVLELIEWERRRRSEETRFGIRKSQPVRCRLKQRLLAALSSPHEYAPRAV